MFLRKCFAKYSILSLMEIEKKWTMSQLILHYLSAGVLILILDLVTIFLISSIETLVICSSAKVQKYTESFMKHFLSIIEPHSNSSLSLTATRPFHLHSIFATVKTESNSV